MEYSEAKKKEKPYVERFLKERFFKFVGTCNCGGIRNYKYSDLKGRIIIYVRYKQGYFKIKQGNQTVKDLTKLDELEKYFQEKIQTASA